MSKEEYIAITQWLEGPQYIGEFEEVDDDQIVQLNQELNFDYVQTNDALQADRLCKLGLNVILSLKAVAQIPADIAYVIIEEEFEGNYDYLANYAELLVAKNVTTANLENVLADDFIAGIHLKGSDEIRPGYKNLDELADILEALEN